MANLRTEERALMAVKACRHSPPANNDTACIHCIYDAVKAAGDEMRVENEALRAKCAATTEQLEYLDFCVHREYHDGKHETCQSDSCELTRDLLADNPGQPLLDRFKVLEDALRAYLVAQRRMLDGWSEGDDKVKKRLWQQLHECESGADKALVACEEGGR